VGEAGGDEPGGGGAERELERLAAARTHTQAPPALGHRDDSRELGVAAEVEDPRAGADAREGSRRAEHAT
jgi:hypothetical protein